LDQLPLWFLPEPDALDEPDHALHEAPAGAPWPLPATGRFTSGRGQRLAGSEPGDGEEESRGIAEIVATVSDALLDLADIGRAGLARAKYLAGRGFDRVWNEDDDDAVETEAASYPTAAPPPPTQPPPRSPANWDPQIDPRRAVPYPPARAGAPPPVGNGHAGAQNGMVPPNGRPVGAPPPPPAERRGAGSR